MRLIAALTNPDSIRTYLPTQPFYPGLSLSQQL